MVSITFDEYDIRAEEGSTTSKGKKWTPIGEAILVVHDIPAGVGVRHATISIRGESVYLPPGVRPHDDDRYGRVHLDALDDIQTIIEHLKIPDYGDILWEMRKPRDAP